MLCPSCSTDVPTGSAFCPKCGQRLDLAAAAPEVAPAGATPAERIQAAKGTGNGNDPELELWRGSFSPKAMLGSWLIAGILTVALLVVCGLLSNSAMWFAALIIVPVVWLVLAGRLLYERLGVEFILTTQRLIHNRGILRRVSNRVETIDIDDVTFEQGFIERMLGVGTIKLLSSDISDPKLILRGIDDVQRVATLIDNARRDQRKKRGLYIETV